MKDEGVPHEGGDYMGKCCCNCRFMRIINRSTFCIKAKAQYIHDQEIIKGDCRIVELNESKYLIIPKQIQYKDEWTILLYYYTAYQWIQFTVIELNAFQSDQIWIDEENGIPIISSCPSKLQEGQSQQAIDENSHYLQLENKANTLMRIYVIYYLDDKFKSMRMDAIASGMTKKIYVPDQAGKLTIKVQEWIFGWRDVALFSYDEISSDHCYLSYDTKNGTRVKRNS